MHNYEGEFGRVKYEARAYALLNDKMEKEYKNEEIPMAVKILPKEHNIKELMITKKDQKAVVDYFLKENELLKKDVKIFREQKETIEEIISKILNEKNKFEEKIASKTL